nr:hypothetical protein [Clostridium ganghwense]
MNGKIENEHRVEQLMNTVENYTRTERHMEQHSDIGDPKRLDHAKEIQRKREEEMEELKNTIVYGPETSSGGVKNDLENLQKNYEYAQGYMEHNADNMNKQNLENLKKKQENRREKMEELK